MKTRNVTWVENLRVFDPPTRLRDRAFGNRYGVEGLLVQIQHDAVAAVADRVGFDLDAATQGFHQHRKDVLLGVHEQAARLRSVAVRSEQRGASRTEGTVDVQLDAPHREAAVALIEH